MKKLSANQVHDILQRFFRSRSDFGVLNAMLAMIVLPRHPFEPTAFSRPQPWFVLFVIFALALVLTFAYFNFFT